MRESLNEGNVKIINNEDEKEKENFNLIISDKEKPFNNYYSFKKYSPIYKYASPLRLSLEKGIFFFDTHIKFFSLVKFFLGFIILVIPLLSIIFIVYKDIYDKNKYIFFPFFISVSLVSCSLLIYVVIKLNDSCRRFGILSLSYERIYNLKIIKLILANFFLFWLLFILENFVISFNLLKEKVTQSKDKVITSKKFNEGTYIIRLLFIFLFWDLEKDKNDEYIYKHIGYFEYEDSFFEDFQLAFNKLLIPIISFCACGIIKIFFIKTKRGFLYIILYLVTIVSSFYIYFYDIVKDRLNQKNKEENEEYFKESNYKYMEIIPISIICILLIILNFKICVIDLVHNKYYSYIDKSRNNFVVFLVLASFILNTLGYLLFLFVLFNLYLRKIEPDFSIESFNRFWIMIYLSVFFILLGYAFPFGHYYFKLLYHSTAFECFDHLLKNKFYINFSGNLRKSSGLFQKRKRDKSF